MPEQILSCHEIAQMIDISAVQAPNGADDIRKLVDITKQYGFGSVHVLPAWVSFAKTLLKDTPNVLLGSPVGFPSGGTHSDVKIAEAKQMVQDGVDELDMMMNIGKLKSGETEYVLEDIRSVVDAVDVPVKVILETHHLTDEEIKKACQICLDSGAAFVKTSTGWAESGATIENITLITSTIAGRIGVKASGGIRDLDTLLAMYRLGVRRFGINAKASVEIIEACQKLPDGLIKVDS